MAFSESSDVQNFIPEGSMPGIPLTTVLITLFNPVPKQFLVKKIRDGDSYLNQFLQAYNDGRAFG